ncbi:MAG: nucleotidyltransferase family protein [Bacteroidota bacterium]|nr:nucleotidyltransferase family protein [Bacteroidota bacterium]
MKALIFAAGLGTRMKPFTHSIPKALIPVNGKPLLQITIEKLKAAGFDEIIVNVHHFANQVIRFLDENDRFGIRVEISDEQDLLLETGGGIKKASWFFDDGKPFLVHNVDILSDVDLAKMYQHHLNSKSDATLLVKEVDADRSLLFDDTGMMKGWTNSVTGEVKSPIAGFNPADYKKYSFGGIHILSPSVLNDMDKWEGKFSIIDYYLSIAEKARLQAYLQNDCYLLDVGKPEAIEKAEAFLR